MAGGSLTASAAELVVWGPIGRAARAGSWRRQAEPTLDRIDAALGEGRREDAAALVRHLPVEAREIHQLLSDWCARIPEILVREGADRAAVEAKGAGLRAGAGAVDFDAAWREFERRAEETADRVRAGEAGSQEVAGVVASWLAGHDPHLILTAGWVDAAVAELGEARLGELWAELQPIEAYDRYDVAVNPWRESFERLMQIALEGMHAHYGGPRRRGEIELIEHPDRIEMRFDPCGSGGRVRNQELYGVTSERYPFAWNELGICHYCIHCCVLQQLEPIRRIGHPGRVIEPPRKPGDECSWSVYRDPSLVPDEAYERVGEKPPRRGEPG